MQPVKRLGVIVIQVGLLGAFVGLGLFGLFLMGIALAEPVGVFKTLAVFLLGFFGFIAGAGYVTTILRQRNTGPRSAAQTT